MKTLIEFLEEKRNRLINGVYSVSRTGCLLIDGCLYGGSVDCSEGLKKTDESYIVNDGRIKQLLSDPQSFHKTASDYLKDGADLLSERGKQYDKSGQERSMEKIVRIFNDMTGQDLTTVQGWYFMQVLKDVRFFQNPETVHEDSLLDKISYAALLAEEALKNDE